MQTSKGNWGGSKGAAGAFGVTSDAVFGGTIVGANATGLDLTTAWNVNAAYEHFWNKQWRTSLYGGYAAVSYNAEAQAMLCSVENAAAFGTGSTAVLTGTCNNNWSTWWLGSRTQWNVTADTYLGLDVMYSKLKSADAGGVAGLGATAVTTTGGQGGVTVPGSSTTVAGGKTDIDNFAFRFRVHRDFHP